MTQLYVDNPLYFVTTCTRRRMSVLASDMSVHVLVAEWTSALDRHGWAVGSYVVMPDHVHFFCRAADERNSLSEFMAAWKQWTSKGIGQSTRVSGGIWQPEFFDHVVRSDESYAQKWRYVRENPVRKGLVSDASAWPYQGSVHFA